jgi:hypothetical protein
MELAYLMMDGLAACIDVVSLHLGLFSGGSYCMNLPPLLKKRREI